MRITCRADDIYRRHVQLALSAARAVSRRTGTPYSVLEGEALAQLAWLVVAQWGSYDGSKSRPSTWIYLKIYRALQNCAARRGLRARREGAEVPEGYPARGPSRLEVVLAEVGDEGWTLLRVILEAPGAVRDALDPRDPARAVRALDGYLARGRWKPEAIERAWAQLESALYT